MLDTFRKDFPLSGHEREIEGGGIEISVEVPINKAIQIDSRIVQYYCR
jgi:hypothetical protein